MTRPLLLLNPLAIAAVVALGLAACRLAGVPPHATSAALAAAAGLLASTVAILPLLRSRWSHPTGPAQAALLALVAHLGAMLVTAVASLLRVGPAERLPLLVWLLAMYWTTLAGVATVCVRAVTAEARGLPGGDRHGR